jgi:uncharacterized membrane protein
VLAAHGGAVPAGAVLAGISLGRTRTLYQDPAFGIRQLVDIAIQALSPAVNQPTTAVQVIDRLEDSSDGQVRLVQPAMTWDEFIELAFTEITAYGASSAQVARRLLAVYDALATGAPAHRDGVRAGRLALLTEAASRGVPQSALRADAMGLG